MPRRATAVLLALAAATLAACGVTTEIRGSVTLAPGQTAPDAGPHRLVVAAFAHGDLPGGVPRPGALPLPGLYATIVVSNGEFATSPIAFDIVNSGGCPDADVVAWWKVHDAPGDDGFVPVTKGDRVSAAHRVFKGSDGGKHSFASNVDLSVAGTLLANTALSAVLPSETPAP